MENTLQDEKGLYEEVRQRVRRKFQRRMEFVTNITAFIVFNVIVWAVWMFTPLRTRMEVWMPMLVSGVTAAALLTALLKTVSDEFEERAVQREVEKERAWRLQALDKAKNEDRPFAHLTDDGELVEDFVQDQESDRKIRRG